ncbi:MAG TPA: ABC transporter substrate-binding protein [Candidatus Sulfotelmatobacter sp.]|nr:ABC transporter substrate-binding protein [Candidatus Sulfotelmatobacter sp.]
MRIVSLLPSATESLFALGLGDQLVAVTHECDFPPAAARLPCVTRPALSLERESSAGIETAVSLASSEGRSLYEVDTDAIRRLAPDLVVAQDICDVCAIPADQVAADLAGIPMITQHPHTLGDVLADIEALALTCGADPALLLDSLDRRVEAASREAAALPLVRGVFLEWIDPPYPAGHWTPDLLSLARIEDPLARAGVPSVAISWDDVKAARPEILIIAPCGFDGARAEREVENVRRAVDGVGARRVIVLDGSAYFNRPGPRVVDSLELLIASR